MKKYFYDIQSVWLNRPESTEIIGRKFLETLNSFERIDPSFRDWRTLDKGDEEFRGRPVTDVKAGIADFVQSNVQDNDWGEPDPDDGYNLIAVNRYGDDSTRTDRSVSFRVHAGSKWRNEYTFEVGSNAVPPDPKFVSYKIYRSALLVLVSIWPAAWANACCAIWGADPPSLPSGQPFPYSHFQMPWVSYLSAARAEGLRVPSEVSTERTPDGGLLMVAADTRFEPTNPDHLRRSRIMAEIMIARATDGDPDAS